MDNPKNIYNKGKKTSLHCGIMIGHVETMLGILNTAINKEPSNYRA
jgi:hypothetical protein